MKPRQLANWVCIKANVLHTGIPSCMIKAGR
jgi:hypothetical protein